MAINYAALKQRPFPDIAHTYGPTDCILYALGVGAGMDPQDGGALAFTWERELKALPTMAAVLGYPGFWLQEPDTGLDWKTVLHIDQEIVLHRPLATSGTVIGRTRIEEIHDRGVKDGVGRGALLHTRRDIVDGMTGAPVATVRLTELCRGEGGFGGPPPPRIVTRPFPEDEPDGSLLLPVSPQAPLIYRLSGDDNALHVDPATARAAGFERPILHGLSTFGMAGRAALRFFCGDEPARLKAMRVRFTAPVLPGDTLRVDMWHSAPGQGRFRAFVAREDRLVLDDGDVEFHPSPSAFRSDGRTCRMEEPDR
ncbi:acyl dehydratase [Pseudochelatococcus lubricantis]|uniref:Acyl dehydratase n=1 Tax=Pseudochelatococcus lubricantis TaxID=1538102 RepID=A0ABX0UTR4_9HYPH|nr:MaoC family dehydratase [Pseudochelatococcus lubricantis]NIJ56358.1 acyl dehydratase [Pseudochelatococcus lubricantis]